MLLELDDPPPRFPSRRARAPRHQEPYVCSLIGTAELRRHEGRARMVWPQWLKHPISDALVDASINESMHQSIEHESVNDFHIQAKIDGGTLCRGLA